MGQVGARWRFVGPIQLIAGTDLATETLEPHEFMEFVAGRIAHRYISSSDVLERQLGATDSDRLRLERRDDFHQRWSRYSQSIGDCFIQREPRA